MNITSVLSLSLAQEGPGGYLWGSHHRHYIAWSAGRCGLSTEDLAAACGYRKLAKFDRRRRKWNEGKGRIPLRYLEAIDVDLALLGDCVALDRREHEAALREARYPGFFVARVAAALYIKVPFPEGTHESDGVRLMVEYATANEQSCRIVYPELLAISVSRTGHVDSWSLAPELEVEGGTVSFGEPANEAGTMRPR